MSPRLLETGRCPHCGEAIEERGLRSCPACGGSLQKRHLASGCLSTGPRLLLLAGGLALAAARLSGGDDAREHEEHAPAGVERPAEDAREAAPPARR